MSHSTARAGRDRASLYQEITDIDAVFQQMGREAVPQCMRADPLGDIRRVRRFDDNAMQLAGTDRVHRVLPRKEPAVAMHHALLPPDLPPLAQLSNSG
jgi:hypothetical protein